jgi:MFS family permease
MTANVVLDMGSGRTLSQETRRVVTASSLGTLLELYDYYLYGSLAFILAMHFYPKESPTAGFLAALATYGAGYLIRPLGAVIFGRLGDRIGRKRTFLITVVLMGLSTAGAGILPSFETIGWAAPVMLVLLRLLQGMAYGGEYGGAVIYVAENTAADRRGYLTSWIQSTSTAGLILSLVVIMACRVVLGEKVFADWGWRIPFLVSIALLLVSVYMRLKLHESPVFEKMLADGRRSKAPVADSLGNWVNLRLVVITTIAIAGQSVVWIASQFYILFFVTSTLKLDYSVAFPLIVVTLVIGTPFFLVFGALSDRIGRKWILVTGLALTAATLMPVYGAITTAVNPALAKFLATVPITVQAPSEQCNFNVFSKPVSDCDKVRDFLTRSGVTYTLSAGTADAATRTTVGGTAIAGYDEAAFKQALARNGYSGKADPAAVNRLLVIVLMLLLMLCVGMVYGPAAAMLVELFPAPIRYTSFSISYHIGAGVIGGSMAFFATAMQVYTGNIFAGLYYPIGFCIVGAVVSALFLPETRGRDIS